MIRVSWETKEYLDALKKHPQEAVGDVVKRILQENKTLHTEKSTLLKQVLNFQSHETSPSSMMPSLIVTPTGIGCLMPNGEIPK